MKSTLWTELAAGDCAVKQVDERGGHIMSVKIEHPELKRPLWFAESRAGNFYWRNTRRESDTYADGYIIRGELDGLIAAPRAYPELSGVTK